MYNKYMPIPINPNNLKSQYKEKEEEEEEDKANTYRELHATHKVTKCSSKKNRRIIGVSCFCFTLLLLFYLLTSILTASTQKTMIACNLLFCRVAMTHLCFSALRNRGQSKIVMFIRCLVAQMYHIARLEFVEIKDIQNIFGLKLNSYRPSKRILAK